MSGMDKPKIKSKLEQEVFSSKKIFSVRTGAFRFTFFGDKVGAFEHYYFSSQLELEFLGSNQGMTGS